MLTDKGKLALAEEINSELVSALEEVIQVVKYWHGVEGFEIYLKSSPELKRARTILDRIGRPVCSRSPKS
jgi:hypothetical protein